MLISLRSLIEPSEVALSNPLTAGHVGSGRHHYIPMGVGSEALSLFANERHVFIPSSLSHNGCVWTGGSSLIHVEGTLDLHFSNMVPGR